MPQNSFTPVSVRRRSAAHGCATAHPDARSAGGRPELRTPTIRGLTYFSALCRTNLLAAGLLPRVEGWGSTPMQAGQNMHIASASARSATGVGMIGHKSMNHCDPSRRGKHASYEQNIRLTRDAPRAPYSKFCMTACVLQ